MTEAKSISAIARPNTRESLSEDLRRGGVSPGMNLIVHSSLRSLGWVCGGPETVILAILDVLGPEGTLVMPTHSSANSEPSYWSSPPVPESWHATIREHMPPFDPRLTPTRGMGTIPELFRTYPNVQRSYHPSLSFAAFGPQAERVTREHGLDDGLGEQSPLARLYDLDGHVLLLGVGHESNTSLHLGEVRAPGAEYELQGAAIYDENGERAWVTFRELKEESERFKDLGAAYERENPHKVFKTGLATTRLFSQRALVDFATRWVEADRRARREALS